MTPTLWTIAQIPLGWFAADLLTALVHLTLDKSWFARDWPLIGRIVREFREHHDMPWLMPQRSFWTSSKETTLSAVCILPLAYWLPVFALTWAFGIFVSQEVHKYAHRYAAPRWVNFFQSLHVMLPPGSHERHHNGVFNRNFGILNGWSNPVVNGFLRLTELIFYRKPGTEKV